MSEVSGCCKLKAPFFVLSASRFPDGPMHVRNKWMEYMTHGMCIGAIGAGDGSFRMEPWVKGLKVQPPEEGGGNGCIL